MQAKETYWETESPVAETQPYLEPVLEIRWSLTVLRRPEGWRVRHLMYTIVIAAILLWLFVLIGSVFAALAALVVMVATVINAGGLSWRGGGRPGRIRSWA